MTIFKKNSKVETSASQSPYLDAKQEWLERYGSYISRAAQWRVAAVFAMICCALSIGLNIMQAQQVKTIPYIVQVDKLGKHAVVARADKASATPLRLIQAEIASCITDWRTVTADIELQKMMIKRLSFFFAGSAKGVLHEWYSENNPYEIAKKGQLVHIEITALPLPLSTDTYRVQWLETIRSHAGATLQATTYEATVTIQITPPSSEETLLHNPGGVYITQIATSRVFDNHTNPANGNAEAAKN